MVYQVNKQRVGKQIESIRKRLNLTMPEFAERIGVTKGAVNNYEKGRSIPKSPILNKIIKISGMPTMTKELFLYGDFKTYLIELFAELPNFSTENKDWLAILDKLDELHNQNELNYGDEAVIFKELRKHDRTLAETTAFTNLLTEYIKKRNDYVVLEDDVFTSNILPMFESDYLDFDDATKRKIAEDISMLIAKERIKRK